MRQSSPKYFEIEFSSDLSGNLIGESDPDVFAISTCAKQAGKICLAAQGRNWDRVVSVIDGAMICRTDVVNAIQSSDIKIGRGHPLEVEFGNLEGRIRKLDQPVYSWFQVLRELEVESIPQGPNLNPLIFPLRKIPVISSKPKSDVFGLCDSSSFIYCNLRFVEIARKEGWDFLRFTPLDMPKKLGSYWFVDHLGKQWPPQWYPDGVEPHTANQSRDDRPDEACLHGIFREPKADPSEVPKKSIE